MRARCGSGQWSARTPKDGTRSILWGSGTRKDSSAIRRERPSPGRSSRCETLGAARLLSSGPSLPGSVGVSARIQRPCPSSPVPTCTRVPSCRVPSGTSMRKRPSPWKVGAAALGLHGGMGPASCSERRRHARHPCRLAENDPRRILSAGLTPSPAETVLTDPGVPSPPRENRDSDRLPDDRGGAARSGRRDPGIRIP